MRLPREAVDRLIGKMAHPLNPPRLDPALGRVVEGYAILQPRVTPALPVGRTGTLFLSVFSAPPVSTPMRPRSPTSIRTCSGRDPKPARALAGADGLAHRLLAFRW